MLNFRFQRPLLSCQALACLALACLTLSASFAASAEVYRWTDAQGNTVYSDRNLSNKAKTPAAKSNSVNYYSPPKSGAKNADSSPSPAQTLATLEVVDESAGDDGDGEGQEDKPLTEAQCQQRYQRSCDQVNNWQKYAREQCGSDSRCKDPDYLDRKYRPRTIAELREVARRAAVRNSNIDDNIDLFLKKKYSNYCENQAAMYCRQQRSSSCMDQVVAYCKDPRGLEDILAKYHNLTPVQKQAVIEQAKARVLANGEDSLNYEQMLASLVDILISQAIMGL